MEKRRILYFFILILILAVYSYSSLNFKTGETIQNENSNEKEIEVAILERVIDGDTVELKDKRKIRLLGINTPEKKMPYSESAKEFLSNFINETLILEYDKDKIDKYNRTLGYVFFDNRFLNMEILENGWANAYMTSNLKYEKTFLRAQAQAIKFGRGMWKPSSQNCSSCIKILTLNAKEEYFILENVCSFDCNLNNWFVKDTGRNVFKLTQIRESEKQQFNSSILKKEVWNNLGDTLFLFDSNGELVLYYSY